MSGVIGDIFPEAMEASVDKEGTVIGYGVFSSTAIFPSPMIARATDSTKEEEP